MRDDDDGGGVDDDRKTDSKTALARTDDFDDCV